MDRREFLNVLGGAVLAAGGGGAGVRLITARKMRTSAEDSTRASRWGMVIDLNKCVEECTACLDACRTENNVAHHGDDRWDIHWIRKVKIRSTHSKVALERTVVLLCNHCDNPPCAQVCPVQATYQRKDGIVLVDQHRCIGCRYCVMSCPYNARYFNFKENHEWHNVDYPKRSHGVAESCHFCAHLLDDGKDPACVTTCRDLGHEAIVIGDLDVPESNVSRLIDTTAPKRIREDIGTEPKVYYIGL